MRRKGNEVIKARIEEYMVEDREVTAEQLGHTLPFIVFPESLRAFRRDIV